MHYCLSVIKCPVASCCTGGDTFTRPLSELTHPAASHEKAAALSRVVGPSAFARSDSYSRTLLSDDEGLEDVPADTRLLGIPALATTSTSVPKEKLTIFGVQLQSESKANMLARQVRVL